MNKFLKLNACGNDFLFFFKKINLLLLNKFCFKKSGITSDQIFFLNKILFNNKIIKIKIFNNNLSRAYNCANGIRCINWYFLKKKKNKEIINLLLKKNYIYLTKNYKNNFTIFNFSKKIKKIFFRINNIFIKIGFVDILNLHLIILIKNIRSKYIIFLKKIIKKFFNDSFNIEFLQIINNYNYYLRIFERGVDETYSCGTGIISIFIYLNTFLKIKNLIYINTIGGNCYIFIIKNFIIISGKVNFCCYGYI